MKNPFYTAMWRLGRPILLLLHPIEVSGKENLPEDETVLLCANHSSAWDPILLILALKDEYPLRIMAKKQLFQIPVVGGFLKMMGVFPVDRGNSDISAIRTAIQSLKDGYSLLVFPEGTRVKEPGQVRPKGGVVMIGVRSGVKLLPVFIGTEKKLFHKVPIRIGETYAPAYTGRHGTAEEYQAGADEVMRRVYEMGGIVCK